MHKYCVYLIVYSGNKLPIFYVGHTLLEQLEKGYRGSVSSVVYKTLWEKELKQHPNLFKYKILKTYSTRKEAIEKELYLLQKLRVTKNPLYVNKGAFPHFETENRKGKTHEEIFGKEKAQSISRKISNTLKKKYKSGEIINPLKGKKNLRFSEYNRTRIPLKGWNKGLTKETSTKIAEMARNMKGVKKQLKIPRFSEETKLKMSNTAKNRSEETKLNMSIAAKNRWKRTHLHLG